MKRLLFIFLTFVLALSLVACSNPPPENDTQGDNGDNGGADGGSHTHTYSDEWEQNEESHWHKCTSIGCTSASDLAPHSFGSWVTVSEPTADAYGKRERVCTVCSRLDSELIEYCEPISEEDFVELFAFVNVRISVVQSEEEAAYDILVAGSLVAYAENGEQIITDRSALSAVNFSEHYAAFDYDGNTLVSNTDITLNDTYGSYSVSDVVIILDDSRIMSITYTADFGEIIGECSVCYTFSDWDEVEITEPEMTLPQEEYAQAIDASRYVNFTTESEQYDENYEKTFWMKLSVDEDGYYHSVNFSGMIVGQYIEQSDYGPTYMEGLLSLLDGISSSDFTFDPVSSCWYYDGVVERDDGTSLQDIYLSIRDGMIEELSYTELVSETGKTTYAYNIFYDVGSTDAADTEQDGADDGVSSNTYSYEKWEALFDIQNAEIDYTSTVDGHISRSKYLVNGDTVVVVSADMTSMSDRSELKPFDFTDCYSRFTYDGESSFTADSVQVSLGEGVYIEYNSVTVKISDDRLSEISYTVSLMGMTIKDKYTFSNWGEVELVVAVTDTQYEQYLDTVTDIERMAQCTEISRDEYNEDETYYVGWYYEITDTGYNYSYYSSIDGIEVSDEGSMTAQNFATEHTAALRALLSSISADELAYCEYTDTYTCEAQINVGNTVITNITVVLADGYIDSVSYCQTNEDGTVVFIEECYWY